MPSLVGNKPNQVPTNGDLGTLAFQDANAVNITGGTVSNVTNTGVTTVSAGTVSAPAITTTGDTNTGIFFPAADTIAFTEGGVESMRITSAGNVGIGISTPLVNLSLNGAAVTIGTANILRLLDDGSPVTSTTSNSYGFGFNNSTGQFSYTAGVGGSHTWFTANTERMRINSSGSVGIGTTNPTARLQVNSSSAVIANFIGNNANNYIQMSDNNGTNLASVGSIAGGNWYLYTTGYGAFYTGGTERMRLDSAGNLGLGVTPSAWVSTAKVLVLGSTQSGTIAALSGGSFSMENNSYTNSGGVGTYIATGYATRYYQSSGGAHVWNTAPSGTAGNAITFTQAMTLNASGNLGIGITSPFADTNYQSVDIRGTTGGQINLGTTSTRVGQIGADATNGLTLNTATATPVRIFTNGSERMRIDSSGNVGIGTSAPQSKLDIGVGATAAPTYVGTIRLPMHAAQSLSSVGGLEFMATSFSSGYGYRIAAFDLGGGSTPLVFESRANSASWTERMRIDASGNVGIGATANASAILDVQSTTKGVRMPNMTTTQKNAISSPAAGLMVFDTTLAKLCVYTGAAWQTITSV